MALCVLRRLPTTAAASLRLLRPLSAALAHPGARRGFHTAGAPAMTVHAPVINEEDAKFIVRSPYSDVELPEANLADYVWKDVDKWADNVALVRFTKLWKRICIAPFDYVKLARVHYREGIVNPTIC